MIQFFIPVNFKCHPTFLYDLGALKICLQSDTTTYVRIHPKHIYTFKYPKTTNMLTEIYIFVHLFRYAICNFPFNMQVYRYVI